MTRNGIAYRRRPSAPRISATGFSCWATPLANRRQSTPSKVRHGIRLANQVHATYWPTPAACVPSDREHPSTWFARRERQGQRGVPLSIAVQMFPTSTVHGNHNSRGSSRKSSDGLSTFVKRLEGPSGDATPPKVLNPAWVEWLMGFPEGWTDLED